MPYTPVFIPTHTPVFIPSPYSYSYWGDVTPEELAAALIVINIVFIPVLVYQVFQYRKYRKAFKPDFMQSEPYDFVSWTTLDGGAIPCLVVYFGVASDAMAVFALAIQLVLGLI